MADIVNELEERKRQVNESLERLGDWGSQKKEALMRIKNALEALILAYSCPDSPPLSSSQIEEILNQQYGFEEQKKEILESLKIRQYTERRGIKLSPLIICLTGPAGTGKTTFARIFAKSLNKKFFSLSLGGISEASTLVGTESSSLGSEMGRLAKCLVENRTVDCLILLDEVDKASKRIHNVLLSILDPEQNQKIYDYYLDTNLDLSRVTFVVTANDLQKVSPPLLSRLKIIELKEYTLEQKKGIARKIIQSRLAEDNISSQLLEIPEESLNILISKTHEKGVRQLKLGLENIFLYCFLQWAEEVEQGRSESPVIITSDLINQIIPNDFVNIDQQEGQEEQLERLKKELSAWQKEKDKNSQNKLSANKLSALRLIQQSLNNANLKKESLGLKDYEEKINNSSSLEEVEIIREDVLLDIAQKSTGQKLSNNWHFPDYHQSWLEKNQLIEERNKKKNDFKKLHEQLIKSKQWKEKLKNQISNLQEKSSSQIQFLKEEIHNLKEQQKPKNKFNWKIEKNPWFLVSIISFIFLGIGIFKKKLLRSKNK